MDASLAKRIEEYAAKLPGVSEVFHAEGDVLKRLTEKLTDADANRLVFASCTPIIMRSFFKKPSGGPPQSLSLRNCRPESHRR
jgi:heterodisulfide reductase subunit A